MPQRQTQTAPDPPQPARALRRVDCYGETLTLVDDGRRDRFFGLLEAGRWEPQTFRNFARFIDGNTVFIDIGGWIGVTPYWAARRAKRVITLEPDPVCFEQLRAVRDENPGDVEIIQAALSDRPTVALRPVKRFGTSESSIVHGDAGQAVTVKGLAVADLKAMAGDAPVFVKIDIEGYEYVIRGELARLVTLAPKAVQIAVHPQLLEQSLSGPFPLRRLRTVWRTMGLCRLLKGYGVGGRRGLPLRYLVMDVALARRCRGIDLLFEPVRDQ